jgi:hypothetical protein
MNPTVNPPWERNILNALRSISDIDAYPATFMRMSKSARRLFITCRTPNSPSILNPQIHIRPMQTAFAPSASALNTSEPIVYLTMLKPVYTTSYTRVEKDCELLADRVNDFRKHIQTANCSIDLSACVITHNNTIAFVFDSFQCVFNGLNSFQKERSPI